MPYLCGFQQFICDQRVTNQKILIIPNLIQYNAKKPQGLTPRGLNFIFLNCDQVFPGLLPTLSVYHQYSISGLLILL